MASMHCSMPPHVHDALALLNVTTSDGRPGRGQIVIQYCLTQGAACGAPSGGPTPRKFPHTVRTARWTYCA